MVRGWSGGRDWGFILKATFKATDVIIGMCVCGRRVDREANDQI